LSGDVRVRDIDDAWLIDDMRVRRLDDVRRGEPDPDDRPLWLQVDDGRRIELAAIPSIGRHGHYSDWASPVLRVDPSARIRGGSSVHAQIVSTQWGGLLAFLGERNFVAAGLIYRELSLSGRLRDAMSIKVQNPIAANAAALVAVQTGALAAAESALFPEEWLRNLANWFPTLPDGAVVLARHIQTKRPGPKGRAEALELYREAFDRGVPIFSLALTWLAEGLDRLDRDSEAARAARDMNWMQDPDRVFTVLRLPDETKEDLP
jgi:hypothetical protein